jgi:hypothetical protein
MKERREGRSTLVEGVVAADLVEGSGKGGWKWGGDLEFVTEFTIHMGNLEFPMASRFMFVKHTTLSTSPTPTSLHLC